MANVFRSFCFVACLITGIYGCIIFYHFRNAKRMLWFALLCLVMAVNVNFTVSFYPHRLFDAGQSAGINANICIHGDTIKNILSKPENSLLVIKRLNNGPE